MYFSELQQKLLIDQATGKIIGYIEDAEVTAQKGQVEVEGYVVSGSTRFFQKQGTDRFVTMSEVVSVEADFIFLKSVEH